MASVQVTTTADQDRAIAFYVGRGQAADAEAFVQAAVAQALNDLVPRVVEQKRTDLFQKLAQVDDEAVLGAIAALLEGV